MARIQVQLSNGMTGSIDENEFDPKTMKYLGAGNAPTNNAPAPTKTLTPQQQQLMQTFGINQPQQAPTNDGFIHSLVHPFGVVAEGVKDAGLMALDAAGIRKITGQEQPTFITPQEQQTINQKPLQEGLKTAAGLDAYAIPFGKGANFATKALLPGAAVGLLSGASDEKKSNPLMDLLLGASTAGAFRTATNALGLAGRAVTQQAPERLMNSVFKQGTKASEANIAKGATLGKQALDLSLKGSAPDMYQTAIDKVNGYEDQLQNALANSKKTVPISDIKDAVAPLITQYTKSGNLSAVKAISERVQNIEDANGTSIPVAAANDIKRSIYDEIQKSYGAQATPATEGLKVIAKSLKDSIGNATPAATDLNNHLSVWGQVAKSLLSKMNTEQRNNLLGVTGAMTGAGAILAAPATHGLSLAEPAAQAALGSTAGKTITANALNTAGKIINPDAQSGKLDYLIGQMAGRLGPSLGGNQPTSPDNSQTLPGLPTNIPAGAGAQPQAGATPQQTGAAGPKDGDLSPGKQWQYSATKGDWVPATTKSTDTTGASGMTSESLLAQMYKEYSATGKINPALKQFYDIAKANEKQDAAPTLPAAQQLRHDNLQTALSSLDAAETNLVTAGGAKGPIGGAAATVPFVGQFTDPQGAAYNKTKIELATQLAKAITGGSRPGQEIVQQYLHSLPDVSDTPKYAQAKIDKIRSELLTQAKSFKFSDIMAAYQ